ncbi:ralA-binding protein 1-like [Macrobrachium nipponense]|uniref:ralA-binding protein 1-like n=1 Tax=Macrobrachium nipponense TaxID=159736 RepID=UPI0030C84B9A
MVETNNLTRIWDAIKGVQGSIDNCTDSHQTPTNAVSSFSSPPSNTEVPPSPIDHSKGTVGLPTSSPSPVPPVEDISPVTITSSPNPPHPISFPQPPFVDADESDHEGSGGWQIQTSKKKRRTSCLASGPEPNIHVSPRPTHEKRCHGSHVLSSPPP